VADEKTRVLTAAEAAGLMVEPPRFVNGKIVFFCPNGHRLVVAEVHAGKRGRCDKAGCGVGVVIPARPPAEQTAFAGIGEAAADPAADAVPEAEAGDAAADVGLPAAFPAVDAGTTDEPRADESGAEQARGDDTAAGEPAEEAAAAGVDWQFTGGAGDESGGADAGTVEAAPAAASWGGTDGAEPEGEAFDNPTARLVARLWVERDHGGVVELHLTGGSVILPEWYESRWSRGTHGLFASQAADGSITLTAVAWDAIQKVVVRQVQGLPDGMFE
jgi:hypothetical protein